MQETSQVVCRHGNCQTYETTTNASRFSVSVKPADRGPATHYHRGESKTRSVSLAVARNCPYIVCYVVRTFENVTDYC